MSQVSIASRAQIGSPNFSVCKDHPECSFLYLDCHREAHAIGIATPTAASVAVILECTGDICYVYDVDMDRKSSAPEAEPVRYGQHSRCVVEPPLLEAANAITCEIIRDSEGNGLRC